MNRRVYKVVIPVLIIIELSFIFLSFMAYSNKDVKEIKEVSEIDRKRFSMYLEQQDGTYKESDETYWPTSGYQLNHEKTVCSDTKGNVVSGVISFSEGKLTVKSNKTVFCSLYFDIQADIQVSVTTDGEEGLPTTSGYKAELTCSDATATFNEKYQRIEISNVNSAETKCNLNYIQEDTSSYTTLKTEVENKSTSLSYYVGNYSTATAISQSEYGSIEMYYTDEDLNNVETTANWYTYDGTKWIPNLSEFTGSYEDNYYANFYVQSEGYYQICYNNPNEYTDETYYGISYSVYKDSSYFMGGSFSELAEDKCVDLTNITTSDYIQINVWGASEISNEFSFYFKKTNDYYTKYHYRYTGKQPNNYVWFNNELWRIIGSVPTCTNSGCTTSNNLVKIIRDETIGAVSNSSISRLLNEYYLGKKDGTGTSYCYANRSNHVSMCDYRRIGISSDTNDYYRRMIENAYWNYPVYNYEISVLDFFEKELVSNSNTQRNIGVMSLSDYGFASNSSYYNTTLDNYSDGAASTNWLYGHSYETTSSNYVIASYGSVSDSSLSPYGAVARPVLYLNPSVYIISGSGTQSDPYVLGM